MRREKFMVVLGLLALSLLAACASPPERELSSEAPSYATLPNGYEPLNPRLPSPIYAEVTVVPGDNLVRYLERKSGHALNMLSLPAAARTALSALASSMAGAKADGGRSSIS